MGQVLWGAQLGQRGLPKVVPEPAHTLWKGHSIKSVLGDHSWQSGRNGPETISTSWRVISFTILKEKVNSGRQRGQLPKPVQQRAQHPQGRQYTWNRSRILLIQNPHMTQETCRTWTHIRLLLDCVASASLQALQIPTSNQLLWNPGCG